MKAAAVVVCSRSNQNQKIAAGTNGNSSKANVAHSQAHKATQDSRLAPHEHHHNPEINPKPEQ